MEGRGKEREGRQTMRGGEGKGEVERKGNEKSVIWKGGE